MTACIKAKRWSDPVERNDGRRVLICRYRPRGVPKEDENWDEWLPQLGPSPELHAAFWGKHGPAIGWAEYRRRYLIELKQQRETIAALAVRVGADVTVTLLCSSACTNPRRCHRTLLKAVIEKKLGPRR